MSRIIPPQIESTDGVDDRDGMVFLPAELADMGPQEALRQVLAEAAARQASDLFLLMQRRTLDVTIRRLGRLERIAALPMDQGRQLQNALKTLATMDITEHRRPQDGRTFFTIGDDESERRVDVRINAVPTQYGEDMTCRLLDQHAGRLEIDSLGLTDREKAQLLSMLHATGGLILVTGPTGSGKSTTLYAMLQHLNDGQRKLNTIEDPIEYRLDGVRQSQVEPKIDLDFPVLLKSILRQSPDVIMIGEIRDQATAQTAVQAAGSGHLVLATMHAPMAVSALRGLTALGVNPYFLAHGLSGIVTQRLVRVLCPACRIRYDLRYGNVVFEEISGHLRATEGTFLHGASLEGCDACHGEGYSHRTGLFEVMPMTPRLRRMVTEGRPNPEIQRAATEEGMVSFRQAALLRVAQGMTSIEEMMRVIPSEYLQQDDGQFVV